MDLGLTGRVALITGGSWGIGKATALRLAEEGADLALCARRQEVLRQTASEIEEKTGRSVLPVVADVRRAEDLERFVGAAVERFGRVDILVNNAGNASANPFEGVTDEMWREDLDLKLMAAVRTARLCVPEMRKVGGGRIINLTMIGGKTPGPQSLPSSVTRAAGIALTKALSKDLAADNILVNTVCVSNIRSGQGERRFEKMRDQYATLDEFFRARSRQFPLQRYGEAEEVADLIAFLVSARAAYITGDAINIDGGVSPAV